MLKESDLKEKYNVDVRLSEGKNLQFEEEKVQLNPFGDVEEGLESVIVDYA